MPEFSIIIPNWNGAAFLQRCLSATVLSAQATGKPFEIIVVDDASTDGSADGIEDRWPNTRLLRNSRNLGFGASVNRGIEAARASIVVLFNNDLSPREQMVGELIAPLATKSDIFAVSGRTIDWYTGEPNHVNMLVKLFQGQMRLAYEDSRDVSETMFFQGGSCAVRRKEFLEFGGFAPIFHPGYWEDYDLAYLAWKAGWRNIYNPHAVGLHVGQGSMKRAYGAQRIKEIKMRNALLFQWLNFSDPQFIRAACSPIPTKLASYVREGRKSEWTGTWQAIARFPQLYKLREKRKKWWKRTDAEIFAKFENRGILC
ncbi:MAG: glycosyltransferase family 2 protein [Candidatus Sumerlaeaceae bacterium]|jgi:GT2 family glycosyltransferase